MYSFLGRDHQGEKENENPAKRRRGRVDVVLLENGDEVRLKEVRIKIMDVMETEEGRKRKRREEEEERRREQREEEEKEESTKRMGPEWWEKCKYKCTKCGDEEGEFENRDEGQGHCRRRHNNQGWLKVVEVGQFHCGICSMGMPGFKEVVEGHLKMEHNLRMEMYKEYIQGGGKQHIRDKKVGIEKETTSTSPIYSMSNWYNGCQVVCLECGEMFNSKEIVREHCRDEHYGYEQDGEGWKMWKEARCKCTICKEEMTHDKEDIKRHVEEKHKGIRMSKYRNYMRSLNISEEEEEIENQENIESGLGKKEWFDRRTFRCTFCFANFENEEQGERHCREEHPDAGAELRVVGVKPFKCLVCSDTIPGFKEKIFSHLRKEHSLSKESYQEKYLGIERRKRKTIEEIRDWFNGCQFVCLECGDIALSKEAMRYHCKDLHYDERFQIWKEEMFECKICGEKVLHDKEDIKHHLIGSHDGMRLSHYCSKFVDTHRPEKKPKVLIDTTNMIKCLVCGKWIEDMDKLDEHIEKVHKIYDEISKKSIKSRMESRNLWKSIISRE